MPPFGGMPLCLVGKAGGYVDPPLHQTILVAAYPGMRMLLDNETEP